MKICKPDPKSKIQANKNNYCYKKKPINKFKKKNGKYLAQCKDCANKYNRKYMNTYSKQFDKKYYNKAQNLIKICAGKLFSCGKIKKLKYFYRDKSKRDGYRAECIDCNKEYKIYYNKVNKKNISKKRHILYIQNRDKKLKYQKKYTQQHKEQVHNYQSTYHSKPENKIKRNKRQRTKMKNDPVYKMAKTISNQIYIILKQNDSSKLDESCWNYLSFTPNVLIEYIENYFKLPENKWMNWGNHGKLRKDFDRNNPDTWTWQLDHIIPQSKLKYKNMTDQNFNICESLNNYQPLRSDLNNKKKAADWEEFKQSKHYQDYLKTLKKLKLIK